MLNYDDVYKKLVLEVNDPKFDDPMLFGNFCELTESEKDAKLKELFKPGEKRNHYLLTRLNIRAQSAGLGPLGNIFLKFSRNHPELFSSAAAGGSLEQSSQRLTALTDWEAYQIASGASQSKDWSSIQLESCKRLACFAAVLGNTLLISELLEDNSIKLNDSILPEPEQATLLYFAAANGHEKLVEFLIGRGAGCDIPTDRGITPLWAASAYADDDGQVANKYLSIINWLIKDGANIERSSEARSTPFWIACQNGHKEVAELLLAKGVDVNQANPNGVTPLYIACENGHKEVVELLLEKGADVNQANTDKVTPLYIACQNRHKEVVELLLAKGANANQANANGVTPLRFACYSGYKDIAELLLAKGGDANQANTNGATLLWIACQNGHKEVAELLLAKGVDVNQANTDKVTPLYIACQKGHKEVVELLLAERADANRVQNNGATPLYVACYNGHKDVAELLLTKGADANQANEKGFTPLYVACLNGHKGVVQILVEKGADISLAPTQTPAFTPEAVAVQRGHRDIAEYLRFIAQLNIVFSETSTAQQKESAVAQITQAFPNNNWATVNSAKIDFAKSLTRYIVSYFLRTEIKIDWREFETKLQGKLYGLDTFFEKQLAELLPHPTLRSLCVAKAARLASPEAVATSQPALLLLSMLPPHIQEEITHQKETPGK